jgi:hypothetical protein
MKDSYLANGVTVAQVVALFDVARRLWAAAPWNVILSDDSLVRVSCDSLSLKDGVISVVGQRREMFGFLLFPGGLDAHVQFEKAARAGFVPTQSQTSLTYVSPSDLSVHLRREVQKFPWAKPVDGLYPLVTTVAQRGPRPPTSAELETIEAVASGLVELVRIEPHLRDATFGIGSFDHTLRVNTRSGPRELQLRAPCVPPPDDEEDEELVFVRPRTSESSRTARGARRS